MKTYRIKLKTKSSVLTPFQADTIFGHLCWMIKYLDGEDALKKFLEPFKSGRPPFVISDGFPGDYLPKPLSLEINAPVNRRKEIKKQDYLHPKDFHLAQQGIIPDTFISLPDEAIRSVISTHNTINRLTNTTGEEGGVYSLPEKVVPEVSIYLKEFSDGWKDKVVDLLKELSKSGYGKKKSIGKGQFYVTGVEEFDFLSINNADGFVTLSNFCPSKTDPTEGIYKIFVKYGKLGEEFTFSGNPFKKPLLMIRVGSVFKTGSPPRQYYGQMVEQIAQAKPEVVQYAYAFAVSLKYPLANL